MLTANSASAATCLASVHYRDAAQNTGKSALASKAVNTPSECHQFTRESFNANKAWSDPYQVCSNTNGRTLKQPVTIWALDQYEGGGDKFNRVIAYTVDCSLAGGVPGILTDNSTGP
ncbi:protein of unknown function [Candidatus Nitrotoga arctica]|uniref:Uncharacterized protein n=1 Tax=Candidatus Nitrotoga arctica TaxID=453162 RepID=A0ABM8YX03_9PROT|nr:protein of unknown function [Candidatus Nitrotoga arctica]